MNDGVIRVVNDGFGNFVEPTSTPTNPSNEPVAHPVSINPDANRTTTSVSADGTVNTKTSALRMNSNELFGTDGDGILATAVNAYGRPVSGTELTPTCIVTVPNGKGGTMTIRLQEAESLKLVKRNESGNWVDTTPEERETTPETQNDDEGEAFTNPTEEAALVSLATALPAEVHHEIIAAFVSGRGLDVARVHDIGASIGKTPEEFQQQLDAVMASFQGQADASARALGITDAQDLSDFYEWARTNHRDALADAMRQHGYARSTRGYVELANKWLNSTLPSEDALRKAGYKLGKTGDGKTTTVFINGQEVSIEVAARRGLV